MAVVVLGGPLPAVARLHSTATTFGMCPDMTGFAPACASVETSSHSATHLSPSSMGPIA